MVADDLPVGFDDDVAVMDGRIAVPELSAGLDVVFAVFPIVSVPESLSQNTVTFFPMKAISGLSGMVLTFLR